MASILNTLLNTQGLKIFTTAVQIARLDTTLAGAGLFTLFVPSDRAFTRFSSVALQELVSDIPLLTKTLNTHIVYGSLTYQNLLRMRKSGEQEILLKSINGSLLHIDLSYGIRIDKSTVISKDISSDNGIIHSIDRLLTPK